MGLFSFFIAFRFWLIFRHFSIVWNKDSGLIKTESTRGKTDLLSILQAEARAEFAERSVQKLQKEVDRLEGKVVVVGSKKLAKCVSTQFRYFTSVHFVFFIYFNFFFVLFDLTLTFNIADDILNEKEKNKLLSDEMEATLYDIQNM